MSPNNQQLAFEQKIRTMAEGFRSFSETTPELTFRSEVLHPEQVVLRFHKMLDLFEAVRTTQAQHEAALEACARGIPACKAFYEEAVVVAKCHHGSDPKKLAAFGLTASRRPCAPVHARKPCRGDEETVVVIEEVTGACPEKPCTPPRSKACCPKRTPKSPCRSR